MCTTTAAIIMAAVCAHIFVFALLQYGLSSFQLGDVKLDRFWAINQHTYPKIPTVESQVLTRVTNSEIFLPKSHSM